MLTTQIRNNFNKPSIGAYVSIDQSVPSNLDTMTTNCAVEPTKIVGGSKISQNLIMLFIQSLYDRFFMKFKPVIAGIKGFSQGQSRTPTARLPY